MAVLKEIVNGKNHGSLISQEVWDFRQTHLQSALIAILARHICCHHYSSTDFGPNIYIFATYTAQHMHTLKIKSKCL